MTVSINRLTENTCKAVCYLNSIKISAVIRHMNGYPKIRLS